MYRTIVACYLAFAISAAEAAERPNFVLIFADDLGYSDLGCFGADEIKTPCIDRMAEEGRRFTDFYVASPTCTASRAGLLTGCYPVRIGIDDKVAPRADGTVSPSRVLWPDSPYGLNPDEITVAEVLKDAGYATGMLGKWHLGDAPIFNPTRHGFDEYFGVPYSNDMNPFYYVRGEERLPETIDRDDQIQRYTKKAVDFIRRHREEPFFLYVAHTMPHTPLAASKRFRGESSRGLYGDAVSELDWSTGEILDTLRELSLHERTLVIFTSDNGPWLPRGEKGGSARPFRAGKGTTYEGGMRVPCVMWRPKTVPADTTCSEIASTMDVLPTFAALADVEVPKDRTIDGHNISDLIVGEPNAKSPWQPMFYYFGNELHAVRSGKWKLRAANHLVNEDIYRFRSSPKVPIPAALYNLERDPAEQKNVLRDHPKIAQRLRDYLDQARGELGDSLTEVEPTAAREIGRIDSAP